MSSECGAPFNGAQFDRAAIIERLGGVLHEIDQDLFELLGISGDTGLHGMPDGEVDRGFAQLRGHQRAHFAQQIRG